MRKTYPSDISREQFDKIKALLEGARKKTRPREVDLYEVFCAVLYLLKSGCQWRMLPSDFPDWRNVYAYFRIWNTKRSEETDSLLEQILKKMCWRSSHQQWSDRENELLYFGRTKR